MQKRNYLLFFIFCIQLIAMGAPIEGFMSHKVKMNNFASCILPISLLLIVMINRIDLRHIRQLLVVYGLLSCLQILVFYKWGSDSFLISVYYDVTVAIIFARSLGAKKVFYFIEIAVTSMTFLSVSLWMLVLAFPLIGNALRSISFPPYTTNIDFTIGFFGMPNLADEWYRNCGFAWEPGRFSAIIVLAILINLFRHKFWFNNKNFWILLVGLISTFSTTGFIALFVCIVGVIINYDGKSRRFVKNILIFATTFSFIVSPFMLEKIQVASDSTNWLDDASATYKAANDLEYTPQRLEGLYLELLNVLDSPIIGYGEDSDNSYVRRELFPLTNIHLSNGLVKIFSHFGIPLALLVYVFLWKSSGLFAKIYEIKGRLLFFILVCVINVSYDFFSEPIIVFISLYSVLLPIEEKSLIYGKNTIAVNNNSNF